MNKKMLFVFFCSAKLLLFAGNDFLAGLDAYSRTDWEQASISFEHALVSEPSEHKEALYWLVMSHASAKNYRLALKYSELFLETYAEDERTAEVIYQRGRVFHLYGEYEASTKILTDFIKQYSQHPKVPSAYYWIGESLYETGLYDDAKDMFVCVVRQYPESGKVHDAWHKILLIDKLALQSAIETAKEEKETPADIPPTSLPQIADDDKYRKEDDLQKRVAVLEEKIAALSEQYNKRPKAENDIHKMQEPLRKDRTKNQKQEQLEKERKENERQQELKNLYQRAHTLEKMYEARTKGVKSADKK